MFRKLKIIVVTLAVGIVGLVILINSPLNPAAKQFRNLALAEKHLQAHSDLVLNLNKELLASVEMVTLLKGKAADALISAGAAPR